VTSSVVPDPLAQLWRGYAAKVYGPEYPLYQALAERVATEPALIEMIRACEPHAHDPNMLLAAVQYLVLGDIDHPLAELYSDLPGPTVSSLPPDVGARLLDFCDKFGRELVALMNSRHIQTNETARGSGLAVGLAAAAQHIGEPIALIDDGASAGLNLYLGEYRIDFGPAGSIGPADSPVVLACELRSPVPADLLRIPPITRRLGIDRAPVDLNDADTVRWMLACIWPGKGRQARALSAIQMQRGRPGLVRRGDMVTDLGPALAEMRPQPTVVVTSWSYSYLPLPARDEFLAVLKEAGRHHPVAWVCCDLLGTVPAFVPETPLRESETPSVLGLATFGDGGSWSRGIAFMHSHGAWLDWLG
jgi:hypothetical protein